MPFLLLAFGGVGAFAYFAPAGFFNPSLAQKIQRACDAKSSADCECVGKKTADMMSAEQRAASFDAENPQTRELMNTASQLCLKSRLVTKCQGAKQGNEFQCICIVDASVNAFTTQELDALFGDGQPPARYASIKSTCYR